MKPTLRLKIVSGFLAATVVTLALGAVAARLLTNVKERAETTSRTSLAQVSEVADIQAELLQSQVYGIMLMYGPDEVKGTARDSMIPRTRQATERLRVFGSTPMSLDTTAAYRDVVRNVSWLNKTQNQYLGTDFAVLDPTVPDIAPGIAGLQDYNDHQQALRDSVSALRTGIDADAARAREEANAAADQDLRRLLVLLAVVGTALVIFAVWISGRLVRRLRSTVRGLKRVAEGDLTARFDDSSHDEVGEMATALNTSVSTMHDVLCQIGDDAETLATVAQESRDRVEHVADASVVTMADSRDEHVVLAGMAENLNDVLTIFVLDRRPKTPTAS